MRINSIKSRGPASYMSVLLMCLVLFLLPENLFGWQGDSWVPTVDQLVDIPASPEASAFAEYGKTPVSHYNGTPNISIPIANLKGRSINVPISLTYEAGGIKVEQLATVIGLGWNLNAGGMVTRQVNGLPDDYVSADPEYYPHYSSAVYNNLGTSSVKTYYEYFLNNNMQGGTHTSAMLDAYAEFTKEFEDRMLDSQPDSYSFYAPGLSGSFYVDYATSLGANTFKGVSINGPELHIEVGCSTADSFGVREILSITVYDNMGTRFVFQTPETTYQKDQDVDDRFKEYKSAWVLNFIYTANDRDKVEFVHSSGTYWTNEQYLGRGEVLRGILTGTADCPKTSTPSSSAAPTHRVKQPVLSSVKINEITRAEFTYAQRLDIAGKTRLSKIELFKNDGSSLDEVQIDNNHYFESVTSPVDEYDRRLKLEGVSFWGADGVFENNASQRRDYAFEYDETYDLPSRDSRAQDYWGYYNGESHTQNLIQANTAYDNGTSFNGGDRSVSEAHTKAGILKKVVYPTGGFSEYYYQSNRVFGEPVVDNITQWQEVVYDAGGIIGAVVTSDPADYDNCEDATINMPDLETESFTVTETGGYQLEIEITNESPSTDPIDPIMHFFLYEGTAKSFCDLIADQGTSAGDYILHSETTTNLSTINTTLALDSRNNYRVLIVSNSVNVAYKVFRNELITTTSSSSTSYLVGGLRIYKTVDMTDASSVASTRYFYYDDLSLLSSSTTLSDSFFANSEASSAVLQQPVSMISLAPSESRDGYDFYTCDYVNRLSSNRYRPLGGMISYDHVTEIAWDASDINGFTVYSFENIDRSTLFQTSGPSLNGRVKEQRVFDKDFDIIRKTENEYQAIGLQGTGGLVLSSPIHGYYDMKSDNGSVYYNRTLVRALGGPPQLQPCDVGSESDCLRPGPQNIYEQTTYGIGESWLRLNKTTETNYDGSADMVVETVYDYEDTNPAHYQAVSTQMQDSDGSYYTSFYKYPDDLSDNYMTDLVAAHRTGQVIETTDYKGQDETGTKLRTSKTTFKKDGTDIFPELLQFAIGTNTLEDRIEYLEEDTYGNPILIEKDGSQKIKMIWGHNATVPLAQVSGIADDENVAYTSFETNDGGWTVNGANTTGSNLPSGVKYHDLSNGTVTISGLDTDSRYYVTYWAKTDTPTINGVVSSNDQSSDNAYGWRQYVKLIEGVTQVTISGTALIDEVRLYPEHTQMTSFVYDLPYGITSQTSPNGIITYFEYDSLGRLIYVRDKDRNILKANKYEYGVAANSTSN